MSFFFIYFNANGKKCISSLENNTTRGNAWAQILVIIRKNSHYKSQIWHKAILIVADEWLSLRIVGKFSNSLGSGSLIIHRIESSPHLPWLLTARQRRHADSKLPASLAAFAFEKANAANFFLRLGGR